MLGIPESQDSRQVLSHRGISLSWSNRDTAQRANSHVGYNSLGEMFRRVLPTQSSNFHANSCLWGKMQLAQQPYWWGTPFPLQWGVEARVEGRNLSVCSVFLPLSIPNINDSCVSKEEFAPHYCSMARTAWKWDIRFPSFSAGLREQRQCLSERNKKRRKKKSQDTHVLWEKKGWLTMGSLQIIIVIH